MNKMLLKNFISYWKYSSQLQIKETFILIIDCAIFATSLGAVINEGSTLIVNVSKHPNLIVIFGLFLIKIAYDVYLLIFSFNQYIKLRYGEIINKEYNFSEIKLSEVDIKMGFKLIGHQINESNIDFITVSDEVNDNILNMDYPPKIERNKKVEKNLKKFIKENKDDFIPFLQWQYRYSMFYGKGFFNEKKLCLSKDLNDNINAISCHKATYYDTFLTNNSCGKILCSNQDNRVIASTSEFMPVIRMDDDTVKLKSIASSMMSNEIGVSTLGLTRDNYLVLWTQNRTAQSSNDLLVPTGSGSCDWADNKDNIFYATLERAMQRELWEESGKTMLSESYETIGETKTIGFFRWITKGGKPEFVGLSKLNIDITSFYGDKIEVFNRIECHFDNMEEFKKVICEIKMKNNISVPLFMNLHCLEKYCEKEPEELKKFIGLNN